MNKPYNELTEEEKIALLKDAITQWKEKKQPFEFLSTKHEVALVALDEYYNDPPKFDFPVDPYNPPQKVIDFQEKGGYKTAPIEWQNEVLQLINLLEI